MSNKTILRRSSQTLITSDGILDIDHILKMDPWKEISQLEKGQAGYTQTVLNKAQNLPAPKREGNESLKPRTRRSAIPQLRNNKTKNDEETTANKENTYTSPKLDTTFNYNDRPKKGGIVKRKLDMSEKRCTTKNENSTKSSRRGSKVSIETAKPIGKQPITKNSVTAVPTAVVKGTSTAKTKPEKTVNDKSEISCKTKNTSQRDNLQSRVSTQKKNVSENSSSEEKKRVAKKPPTKNSKNYSISTRGAGSKRLTSEELSSAKNLNNNKDTARLTERKKNNASVDQKEDIKIKLEELKPKTTGVRIPPRPVLSPIVEKHCPDAKTYSKHEAKNATDTKNVGQFEKRLIEKQNRRKKRKMERRERKMGRIMHRFSQEVLKIMKKMDHSQENESFLDSDSSFSSSCGESSFSSSSSWYSCSCTSSSCIHSTSCDTDNCSDDSSCSCSCCSHSEI